VHVNYPFLLNNYVFKSKNIEKLSRVKDQESFPKQNVFN